MGLRLLCVVAHPDDECFAFGGALALAADRGIESSVICLTDGQAATHRGSSANAAELGKMRREEFTESCKILGVTHHELMEYQDAQLEFADMRKLAGELVARIRSLKPHVVITFGAEGGANSHPDHTVVSMATTAAFHWSGNEKRFPEAGPVFQPQKLYYLTTNFFLPKRRKPLPAPWNVTLNISGVFERKQRAFAAHKSQAPLMEEIRAIFEKYGREERYALAAAIKPHPAKQSHDLFENISED